MSFDNKIIYKSRFFDVVLFFKVEHVILTDKLKYTLTKDLRVFCRYIFRMLQPLTQLVVVRQAISAVLETTPFS